MEEIVLGNISEDLARRMDDVIEKERLLDARREYRQAKAIYYVLDGKWTKDEADAQVDEWNAGDRLDAEALEKEHDLLWDKARAELGITSGEDIARRTDDNGTLICGWRPKTTVGEGVH